MKHFSRFVVVIMGFSCGAPCGAQIETTDPLSPREEQRQFQLPPGFEIQLVACEPDIAKPMNLAFDTRGRLWVSSSTEYPYAASSDRRPRDTIKILADTNGDGRADQITTFADGLNIPIGLYPYRDGVICFSVPNIWRLRDRDGDDRADGREILYGPFDTTRDTHGMCNAFRRGLDGWLYACHGFNNQSSVAGTDGHRIEMHSGNIFRIQLDGSRIEHFTHGQVNPFGMAIDRNGDIFTADCHTKPINLLMQGGHHDSFGKPHDGLGYIPNVLEHLHHSTGIGGIALGRGSSFPAEYQDSTFGGNVVTARVNRDTLQYSGSSMVAVEQPDFIVCNDPWFRPVDLVFGPDGALYIADFYNRIIGHYEVPLDHPGRDRHRGRIWRVVHTTRSPVPAAHDFTALTTDQLIANLDTDSTTRASLVVDQLTDGVSADEVTHRAVQIRAMIGSSRSAIQRAHGLRVLQRLGVIEERDIVESLQDPDSAVRTHLYRMLSAAELSRFASWIRGGFADENAMVRRAAVQAAAVHCQEQSVLPLFTLYHQTPTADRYLRHAIRIALRNHLRNEQWFAQVVAQADQVDRQLLVQVCFALKTPIAAEYVAANIDELSVRDREQLGEYLKFAARYAQPQTVAGLSASLRQQYANDLPRQLELLSALRAGLSQQGLGIPGEVRQWATALATELLHVPTGENDAAEPLAWTFVPHHPSDPNPWVLSTRRDTADGGRSVPMFSSFPLGEQRTGTYRSAPFRLRNPFFFYIAGHDGFPDKPRQEKNSVRLRDAGTHEVLRACRPPRNDVAQRVEWDTAPWADRLVYVELVDDDSGAAYAWIAVGLFSESRLSPSRVGPDRIAAAGLITDFELEELRDPLVVILSQHSADRATTVALLGVLAKSTGDSRFRAAARIPTVAGTSDELVTSSVEAIVANDSATVETLVTKAMSSATMDEQLQLAEQLANAGGVETLITAVESGAASPLLLIHPSIRSRLGSLSDAQRDRIELQVRGLPSEHEELEDQIAATKRAYLGQGGDAAAGRKVFAENCRVCHRIGDDGKQVGPNLDGIGNRGLDRLAEDILAPSRNVDAAFLSTLVATTDGQNHVGLLKSELDAQLLLINLKGEEIVIPAGTVEQRSTSRLSPMPANLVATLSLQDRCDLIAFLLTQRASPSN